MWTRTPLLLIAFRLVVGPVILLLVWRSGSAARFACAGLLALGVLSDVFDGVIARRLGCVTDRLRTLDSRADVVFWVSALGAALLLDPALFAKAWRLVLILGGLEIAAHCVSTVRFRKEASPHHLLSKLFGLALWGLLTVIFVTGSDRGLIVPAFLIGVASELEAIAIMMTLPEWRADVRGWAEARRLRMETRA